MQTNLLERYAPHALHLVYHPRDTGNPGHDMTDHIRRNNLRRIDIESTQLVGDRVIGRVEFDLGPVDEQEQQFKILTVRYAEEHLVNNEDAVEFVRIIKQAVGAGVETDPRSLQIWASWAYGEINRRTGQYKAADPTISLDEVADARASIISQVLKELAFMAMELTAITTTSEERLLDEPEVTDYLYLNEKQMTQDERRELFELRCEQVLHQRETTDPFTAELRAVCSKISRAHASGLVYDEEAQYQSYMRELSDKDTDEVVLEAMQESHERVTEQYTEGGVVSLHMTDGEKFIVDGTLDDDIDASYLPREAASLADELLHLFADGEDMETIDKFIEFRLNDIYGDPSDKANRVVRTM
jgi:hypothetical protein